MAADQWAAVAGVAAGASALFAYLAWRVADSQALAERAYLDVDAFKKSFMLRMAGQNADHWEIRSARIIWPLTAKILISEVIQDDYGEPWTPPKYEPKAIGRYTRKLDRAIYSSSPSTVWLFRISLRTSPRKRYSRIVRTSKNI